jgi:beta-galactosidase
MARAESPALRPDPTSGIIPLDSDWFFGGRIKSDEPSQSLRASEPVRVTLPHCVTRLPWKGCDPSSWENGWIYRRHFPAPASLKDARVFLRFDRVMAGATPTINSHRLPQHLGGFLPFEYEITGLIHDGENALAVEVDAGWLNAPPSGSPRGPSSIDYLLPGGMTGSVNLIVRPQVFLRDIFAKPVNVLAASRHVEVRATIDSPFQQPISVTLEASLRDGERVITRTVSDLKVEQAKQETILKLERLGNVKLWDVDQPKLYAIDLQMDIDGKPTHQFTTRIGLREARFEVDGFFLNGQRLQLFGLNRHELFPYVGFAAPNRLIRRDAEILRQKFNCNAVRCSHYPQSEAFLDACDEFGLLVWEELPGWQYLGDESWQQLAIRDVEEMIRRDRNHPSIVIWGVRINESHNDPALYTRTRTLAKSLDDSRATSGTMTSQSMEGWHQDVFAFDDYHARPDYSVSIAEPLPGVPYMVSEAVGQFSYPTGRGFGEKYRRAGDSKQQIDQAIWHAQAHDRAAAYKRCSGVIAWCAFDYASLMNAYEAVKCPGIADVFRIPKLGASFYLAQVDPGIRAVIEPDFYWDFGEQMAAGPGTEAAIFSNCQRLELSVDGEPHAVVHPDRARFPNLKFPPFFADLSRCRPNQELRIDGYADDKLLLSRRFSSNRSLDRFLVEADDHEIEADGVDATRLVFTVADKFGTPRAFAAGQVKCACEGPGEIVGDNPFDLKESGGVGAVWIRSVPDRQGVIRIEAIHSELGKGVVAIRAVESSAG